MDAKQPVPALSALRGPKAEGLPIPSDPKPCDAKTSDPLVTENSLIVAPPITDPITDPTQLQLYREYKGSQIRFPLYKLLHRTKQHFEFQYELGLNQLDPKVETYSPRGDCEAGGLYVTSVS
jgi:hypothetical protein